MRLEAAGDTNRAVAGGAAAAERPPSGAAHSSRVGRRERRRRRQRRRRGERWHLTTGARHARGSVDAAVQRLAAGVHVVLSSCWLTSSPGSKKRGRADEGSGVPRRPPPVRRHLCRRGATKACHSRRAGIAAQPNPVSVAIVQPQALGRDDHAVVLLVTHSRQHAAGACRCTARGGVRGTYH